MDENALDEPTKRLLEGTLGELYEGVDRALGRVLNALPEDADVIVVSPLGMGENTSRADFLGKMLDAAIEGEIVIDVEATACALLGGDLTGLSGTPLLEP